MIYSRTQRSFGILNQNDVKITLNLHPADGVASYEEKYSGLAKDMGVDPQSKQTIPWINSDESLLKICLRMY